MPLFDRMSSIQRVLKEKQAYINARPERAAEWVDRLNTLYDKLDSSLADEVAKGLCTLSRTTTSVESDDLGAYQEPGFTISIENVVYVISSARRAGPMNADTVDLRGLNKEWHVRLRYLPDPAGTLRWSVASAAQAAYVDQVSGAWFTPDVYRQAIERFFPYQQG